MAHVELINFLNNRLVQNGSTEELIIVGPSMGGQISRYALAYMEKQGMDHRTKLWISIDSPHHGANIPIGLQSMVHKLWTKPDEKDPKVAEFYFNEIQSIAAQQQLIEQHNPDPTLGNELIYLNNRSPVRKQYIENLTKNGIEGSGGYPTKPRIISMVNGSLLGKKIGVAGEEDTRAHGFIQRQVFGWEIPGVYQVLDMSTRYMPDFNVHGNVASLWIDQKGRSNTTLTNRNSNGSMDVVPGGYFNAEQEFMEAVTGSDPAVPEILGSDPTLPDSVYDPIFGGFNLSFLNDGAAFFGKLRILYGALDIDVEQRTNKVIHSFIPTYSSLGIKDPSGDWSRSLNRNLVCTRETPFDSYYAPRENQEHTSFTAESVSWMMQELMDNHQPPSVYTRRVDGAGVNVIMCENEVITLSVEQCKVPQAPDWSVDRGLTIVDSSPYSISVKADGNPFRGFVGVTAAFPYWTTRDSVYVGSPQPPASINGPSTFVKDSIVSYQSAKANGATSYSWRVPYPFTTVSNFSSFSPNWEMKATNSRGMAAYTGTKGNAGAVQVMGINRCGVGGARVLNVAPNTSGGGGCSTPPCVIDDGGIR